MASKSLTKQAMAVTLKWLLILLSLVLILACTNVSLNKELAQEIEVYKFDAEFETVSRRTGEHYEDYFTCSDKAATQNFKAISNEDLEALLKVFVEAKHRGMK